MADNQDRFGRMLDYVATQSWPAKAVRSFYDALTLPGDVYAGRTDPASDEAIRRSTDLAGALVGGPMPAAAARGAAPAGEMALGTFGGARALTADRAALGRATEMSAAGAPRGNTWADTGWFQRPYSAWRFEIPDQAAAMTGKPFPETGSPMMPYGDLPLPEVLSHPDLYDAYPFLRDVRVAHDPEYGPNAQYARAESELAGTIGLDATQPGSREALLHEIQHAIQVQENWPGGTSARMDGFGRDPTGDRMAALGIDDTKKNRMDVYRGASGEVEARNVQARANFGHNSRRGIAPWESEDVPAAAQWLSPVPDDIQRAARANDAYEAGGSMGQRIRDLLGYGGR
ncbi:LPD23 domain-containing protein [Xanthobacter sp. VNH20]|uniref:LPD23 domain-containing protein n=1 Tax=Xanthobacter sp. VNH20 TaxID=3156616 RepID=UPI0032B4B637